MKITRDTLVMKRPSSVEKNVWKAAIPQGNGIFGALIPGFISEEKIILTRHDLWHAKPVRSDVPDVSDCLEKMRSLIDRKKYVEAKDVMRDALIERGYASKGSAYPFPLAALLLNYEHDGLYFKHYRRYLDMSTGLCEVSWQDNYGAHSRTSFVSRDNGIFYCRQRNAVRCKYTLDLKMYDDLSPNVDPSVPKEWEMRAGKEQSTYTDSTIAYAANTEGLDFGAALSVEVRDGGSCKYDATANALVIESADFIMKVKSFAREDREEALFACLESLSACDDMETAFESHKALHAALYRALCIELCPDSDENLYKTNEELLDMAYEDTAPTALIEKLYRFGRYTFISGTCEGSNPFPLYGIWPGAYNMCWNANVCNVNVQMIHWHALTGGFAYSIKNLVDYYFAKLDRFKENAEKLYGCRGIYVPVYTIPETLDGNNTADPGTNPVILNWISAAGWLSLHFYDYYIYTKDAETLCEKILPFMIETARFYEDYVTFDGEGKARIYPSVSPENTPGNLMPANFDESMGHVAPVTENATMDIAIMKAFFGMLFELLNNKEAVHSADAVEIAAWKHIYERIPEYMINSDGAIKEWTCPHLDDFYGHRHLSHLFPLFPGNEVTLASDPALIDAFRRAAELRLIRSQSGWSFAYLACIWAKLGEGDRTLNCINTMAKSCLLDNFFTLHNDWRHMGASMIIDHMTPVQLDALMGTVHAVQTMLFQCDKDNLFILPAHPEALTYIRSEGFAFPDGHVDISLLNGTLITRISASRDCKYTVCAPNGNVQKLTLAKGNSATLTFEL